MFLFLNSGFIILYDLVNIVVLLKKIVVYSSAVYLLK